MDARQPLEEANLGRIERVAVAFERGLEEIIESPWETVSSLFK
jgi:hypothetical protein